MCGSGYKTGCGPCSECPYQDLSCNGSLIDGALFYEPKIQDLRCRAVYPYLTASRQKKVHGFNTIFSFFRTENSMIFPRFFFPSHQERTRMMYTGKYRNRRTIRCFLTVIRHRYILYRKFTVVTTRLDAMGKKLCEYAAKPAVFSAQKR
jgi:hypothetical protein